MVFLPSSLFLGGACQSNFCNTKSERDIQADSRHSASLTQRQGFWNAIVYIITSQTACRHLWRALTTGTQHPNKHSAVTPAGHALDAIKPQTTTTTAAAAPTAAPANNKKLDTVKKPERSNFPPLGNSKRKGGDSRLERFASRRASRRLESDESSVASLRREV